METFRGFDVAGFLRDYWQRKPLLIRNPWAEWHNPLEPDELAGLACEPGVESRLIRQEVGGFALEHGPLGEDSFGQTLRAPWTLLVQSVDHHVPAVAALLDPFRFVPNWRVDDVMVSYAVDGGGVGAHFDHYDVFLIQGLGRRRWRVGQHCDDTTPLLPHDELRLLADFRATDEWVLEPGDILYVPPGIAHEGVAVGDDCMTYSVGFRAPSRGELVAAWSGADVEHLRDDDRYADPDPAYPANPGQITAAALGELGALAGANDDADAFARWFGEFTTEPKSALDWAVDEPMSGDEICTAVRAGSWLARNPASRFAYIERGEGVITLFVDGEAFDCAGEAARFGRALCAASRLPVQSELLAEEGGLDLLSELIGEGAVAFEDDA
jgi:50S ribosomal protein L16 3-hydroxylase